MLNRRRFIYGVVSLGILGANPSSETNIAGRAGLPSLRGRLSRDVFLALRQEAFTVSMDDRRATLVLVKVTDALGEPGRGQQFTVVFRGPRDLTLRDGMAVVSHRTAGTTRLYLQPGGVDGHSTSFEAPFNLLS